MHTLTLSVSPEFVTFAVLMAMSPSSIVDEAPKLIEREGGFAAFIQNVGLGGVAYALILEVISAIQSGGSLLLAGPRALARGLENLIDSTIGGSLAILNAGSENAAWSLLEGTASLLGVGTWPLAIVVVMSGIFVFMWFVNKIEFSPLSFIQSLRR